MRLAPRLIGRRPEIKAAVVVLSFVLVAEAVPPPSTNKAPPLRLVVLLVKLMALAVALQVNMPRLTAPTLRTCLTSPRKPPVV